MWPNPQETADSVTFTEEIRNEKPHFLWIVSLKELRVLENLVYIDKLEGKMALMSPAEQIQYVENMLTSMYHTCMEILPIMNRSSKP